MTAPSSPAGSQQAAIDAALVVLKSMGLSPADLTAAPRARAAVPTFAEYVPVVSAAVTDGTRKAYGTYWNRVVEHWGERRLDEPTPSDIRQLMALVKAGAVGEIVGWAFDRQGRMIEGLTNERVASVALDGPARRLVIGAAMGQAKADAIAGALAGRLLGGLITNETMARRLLE